VDELSCTFPYLSVFIAHFLSGPKENIGILRQLFLEFGLSPKKISEFTGGRWARSTIIEALNNNNIKRKV